MAVRPTAEEFSLVRENLNFKVKSIHVDDLGRLLIILDTLIQDSPFLLVNIYAPTKTTEQYQFFEEIDAHIENNINQSEVHITAGGDLTQLSIQILTVQVGGPL